MVKSCEKHENEAEMNKSDEVFNHMPYDAILVISVILGFETAKKWATEKIMGLDGLTGSELCRTDKKLKALKAYIMRLPS